MSGRAVRQRQTEDGVPPSVVFNWLLKRWLPIFLGAVIGLAIALVYYFATPDRFTARLDFAIPESPLGSPTFVQEISTSFLNAQLGTNVVVSVNPQGTISILDANLRSDDAQTRFAAMQEALSNLRNFLNEKTTARYELAQQDLRDNPDNTSAYALVNQFRTYVEAQEAGLFDQINIQREDVTSTKLPLLNTALLGLILGGVTGLFFAAATDMLLGFRRRAVP